MLVAPIVSEQFAAFIDNLPGYLAKLQSLVSDPSRPWLAKMFGGQIVRSRQVGRRSGDAGLGLASPAFLASLWSGGRAVFSVLSLLVITPVVAFYLLCDWDRVVATVDGWIPLPHRDTVRGLARDIDDAIAGFVRGQAVICLILAAFYAIGLTLTGLNFGFLIGLMTGLLELHSLRRRADRISRRRASSRSRSSGRTGRRSLMVVGVFLVGQVLEGYVLSPKLVGAKVGLHPVWLMFALIAFGYLFGFVGLLVAIPLAAAIGVLAALCAAPISRKPDLHRRRGRAEPMPSPGAIVEQRANRASRRSSRSRSTTPRASRARIFSPGRPTPRRLR